MNNDELDKIIDKVVSRSYLTSDDIPDLDLYMDQIMTLFDQHLNDNKRSEDDKLLTKTMINNYSKAKVISPVKGKKYTKEQIIQMLMIYYLKNNLTIQEIKKVLSPLYEENSDLKDTYDQFIQIKHEQTKQLQQFIHQQISSYKLDVSQNKDRLMIMMILSSLSYSLTSIEQFMVDAIEDES